MMSFAVTSYAAGIVQASADHPHFGLRVVVKEPVAQVVEVEQEARFVWPKSVTELLEMDPHYIDNWLRGRKCPPSMIADYRQGLLLHLLTPNDECRENGWPDKMMIYNPEKRGGATTKSAWVHWLSGYLRNQYSKLIDAHKRPGTEGPTVISLTERPAENSDGATVATWMGLLDERERAQFVCTDAHAAATSKVALAEVLQIIQEEVGEEALEVVLAYSGVDSSAQAAEILADPVTVRETMRKVKAVVRNVLGIATEQPVRVRRRPSKVA